MIEHGPRRAHAGIMAAATAIWKDLRAHRILPALLNQPEDDLEDETNPEYDIGAGEGSQSDQHIIQYAIIISVGATVATTLSQCCDLSMVVVKRQMLCSESDWMVVK